MSELEMLRGIVRQVEAILAGDEVGAVQAAAAAVVSLREQQAVIRRLRADIERLAAEIVLIKTEVMP